jgi:hypothetical protein
MLLIPLFALLFLPYAVHSQQNTSRLLPLDANGRLSYVPDEQGNVIPDYSWVGYRNGEVAIPDVPVVLEISPVSGDNRAHIQRAIDSVSARPLVDGFRGTLLLKSGEYRVSGSLNVNVSGVVLRGEGYVDNGTRLIATGRNQYNLIIFSGGSSHRVEQSTVTNLAESYISTGQRTILVGSGHPFESGDRVILRRAPKTAWLSLIGMDDLSECGGKNWSTDYYTLDYRRRILSVDGNYVTLDAPVVDPIDQRYAMGTLLKYTWNGRIENVGLERLRLVSVYQSETDEAHARFGVELQNVEHGWVRDIEARHFVQGALTIGDGSSNVSVLDSRSLDPMSVTEGGKKYSFNIDGQRNLVSGCFTRGGRHDYVTGSVVPGPNVFVNSRAEGQRGDIGPHQRWATGLLFDNIQGDKEITVRNATCRGSGHGWCGAQNMVWNSTAPLIIVQSPPGHMNWAVGNTGRVTNVNGNTYTGGGHLESNNVPVHPQSLYEHQLYERLNPVSGSSPFAAPSHLVAVTLSSSEIALSWQDNSNHELGFLLERSSSSDFSNPNYTREFPAGTIGFTNTNLTSSRTYYYRIMAKYSNGNSAPSGVVSATTLEGPTSERSFIENQQVFELQSQGGELFLQLPPQLEGVLKVQLVHSSGRLLWNYSQMSTSQTSLEIPIRQGLSGGVYYVLYKTSKVQGSHAIYYMP